MFFRHLFTLALAALLLAAAPSAFAVPAIPNVTLIPDLSKHVSSAYERPKDPVAAREVERMSAALEDALREIKEGDYLKRGVRAPKITKKRKQYATFPEPEKKAMFIVEFDAEGRLGSISRVVFKDFVKAIEDPAGRYAVGIREDSIGFARKGDKEILAVSRPAMLPSLYVNSVPGEYTCQVAWNAQGRLESEHAGALTAPTSGTLTVPDFATPLAIVAARSVGGDRPSDPRTAARLRAAIEALRANCTAADALLSGAKPAIRRDGSGRDAQYVAQVAASDGRSTTTFLFTDPAGSGYAEVRKDVLGAGGAIDKKAGFTLRFRKDGVSLLEYRARDSQDTMRFYPNLKLDTYSYPPDKNPLVLYEVHWDEAGKITSQGVKDYGALRKGAAGK